jgi:protocatechuate 3,4-dioxygenase beta subunit
MLLRLLRPMCDESGQAQTYVALAVAVPLILAGWLAGSGVATTVSAQSVLHNAAELADRSITTDGCLTQSAVQQIASYLQTNGINPNEVSLEAPTSAASYGQTIGAAGQPAVSMSYTATVYLPLTSVPVWHPTVTVQVPVDTSQYVQAAVPSQSACASGSQLASVFTGGGGGGGGSYGGPTVSSLTLSASPATVEEGVAVTVSGQAMVGSGPAPAGTVIVISYSGHETSASTDGSGRFSATVAFDAPGVETVTSTAGSASAQATVTVQAPSPASIQLSAPSSVAVGQAVTISGTVLDQSGRAVGDGTKVSITSTDAKDFPAETATTTAGGFTFSFPAGATMLGGVTFTVTAGTASAQATVQVTPGQPETVTLSVTPSSGTAGGSFTVSGTVLGPDGTPVAGGTAVSLSSPDDAQDPLPTLSTDANGHFSGSVTITLAGTIHLVAEAGGVASAPVGVDVSPGPPVQAALSAAPDPVSQGATDMISGTVTDAYGNPVAAGTAITLSSAAFAQAYTAAVGAGGAFSAPVAFDSPGVEDVTASYNGTTLGSVSVQVEAQGAYVITASQPTTTLTAGSTSSVTFTVTDDKGAPVPGLTLDIGETPEGGQTLSATQVVTNAQGQATVYVTPTKAGTAVVTASVDSSGGTSSGTAVWSVEPAAPYAVTALAFSPSTADSTSDGGTVYPVLSGVVTDLYGNVIPGASVSVSGGWDPGHVYTASTDQHGYFSVAVNPVVVGGPYDPTVTVSDALGSFTKTYASPTLTVTVSQSIIPPGTPMNYSVTLTGQWQAGAYQNVFLTATASQSVSGTIWSIGIYDETLGQWVAFGTTGTQLWTGAYSPISPSGQSDTYVAVVGIVKSGLPWQQSAIIAESAPFTLTLPQPQVTYTGCYPSLYYPYPYLGWPIAFDSCTVAEFQNAAVANNGSYPITLYNVSQTGYRGGLVPVMFSSSYSGPYTLFYLEDTWTPITVTWQYDIAGAPSGQFTMNLAPPDPTTLTPWHFYMSTSPYGPIMNSDVYSQKLQDLQIWIYYAGVYYIDNFGLSPSNMTGYSFLAYLGSPTFVSVGNGWNTLYVPPNTTLPAIGIVYSPMYSPYSGPRVQLNCTITMSGSNVTGGSCSQTTTYTQ